MSKFFREVWNFDEKQLAKEMGTTDVVVREALQFLHAYEFIDYSGPSALIGGLSQARLTEREHRLMYRQKLLPTWED